MAENSRNCYFCCVKPSKYTCPGCNKHYCSSACYSTPSHMQCSESFYKAQVQQQLHNHHAPPGSRQLVLEMMQRLKDQEDNLPTDPWEEPVEDEADEDLDSDDDEDLATRMDGVDLDESEDVWSRLNAGERRQFQQLVEHGDLASILPLYIPWWEATSTEGGPVIVELEEQEVQRIKEKQLRLQPSKSIKQEATRTSNLNLEHMIQSNTSIISSATSVTCSTTATNSNVKSNRSSARETIADSSHFDSSATNANSNCISNSTTTRSVVANNSSRAIITKTGTSKCTNTTTVVPTNSAIKRIPQSTVPVFTDMPASLRRKYSHCPSPVRVKMFSALISKPASPLVRYSLFNVVASYAWVLRLFSGDHHACCREAAEAALLLSAALGGSSNFSSSDLALASINMRAMEHPWLGPGSCLEAAVVGDATLLLQGPPELPGYFLHTALADLRAVIAKARDSAADATSDTRSNKDRSSCDSFLSSMKNSPRNIPIILATPKMLNATIRKLDFYLAYAEACKQDINLWSQSMI